VKIRYFNWLQFLISLLMITNCSPIFGCYFSGICLTCWRCRHTLALWWQLIDNTTALCRVFYDMQCKCRCHKVTNRIFQPLYSSRWTLWLTVAICLMIFIHRDTCTLVTLHLQYGRMSCDCFRSLMQHKNVDVPLSVQLVTSELIVWNLTRPLSPAWVLHTLPSHTCTCLLPPLA